LQETIGVVCQHGVRVLSSIFTLQRNAFGIITILSLYLARTDSVQSHWRKYNINLRAAASRRSCHKICSCRCVARCIPIIRIWWDQWPSTLRPALAIIEGTSRTHTRAHIRFSHIFIFFHYVRVLNANALCERTDIRDKKNFVNCIHTILYIYRILIYYLTVKPASILYEHARPYYTYLPT